MRILIIEDDNDYRTTLAEELRTHFAVDTAATAEEGLYLSEINPYDVITLDLGLPDKSGLEVCAALRAKKVAAAILVLSGEGSASQKAQALDMGADDYMVKPFNAEELHARIRALLRRTVVPVRGVVLRAGPVRLDPSTREVYVHDTVVQLRRKEFDLLEFLMRRGPTLTTREEILDHVWDSNVNAFTNSVDVHINFLRNKIDRAYHLDLIQTVHGVGYRMNPNLWVDDSTSNHKEVG